MILLYDISKFLCLLLMALSVFFIALRRKAEIDRSLRAFAVRDLAVSLFCAVYLWALNRNVSYDGAFFMACEVILHVLSAFFPPLFVRGAARVSNGLGGRLVKPLFAAAAAFSALFAAGAMLSTDGLSSLKASPLYTFLFEPYMLGAFACLLCLRAAGLKNAAARRKFTLAARMCGLALFCVSVMVVASSRVTGGGLLRLAGIDASGWALPGVFVTLAFCAAGAFAAINRMAAAAASRDAALANLREAYNDLETTKPLREIGQAAAFINHEIKNYMMVISGYAALLLRSKTLDEKERGMADNIAQTAAKLQKFSMGVLETSKPKASLEDREFDLAEQLKSCAGGGFRKPPPVFSVNCADPQNAVLINGNAAKIERALACAFRNAAEAGAREVGVRLYACNGVALTVIEDDGAGCDAARLPDLSRTFFTTKAGAGGMGLGLCVIRSIVEAHGGSVSVYSKNLLGGGERGLSMQIAIPASKKTPGGAAASEVMLVKEGLGGALAGVTATLKNLKIIPRVAELAKDAGAAPQSRSLSLIILAAARTAADVRKSVGDDSAVKVLSISEGGGGGGGGGGALFVSEAGGGGGGGRVELFTEEYVVRCLHQSR